MANKNLQLEWVSAAAATFGVQLTPTQIDQFQQYERLLQAWSQRLNLTTITDSAEIQRRHFLDSLSFGLFLARWPAFLDRPIPSRLVDMGTGAGFPGLAIKIAFPKLHVTLVDSVAKKGQFLTEVIKQLGLTEVDVIAERAENLGRLPTHREGYDLVVARSVAYMPVLAEYLLPLAKPGGSVVAFKGGRAPAELLEGEGAIQQLGGAHVETIEVRLPQVEEPHYLVVLEKRAETPTKYPRRPGVPKKKPLR